MKVSAVSYLNTRPFVYGLKNYENISDEIELSEDIPSECARKLIEGEAQIGLVPVAALPQIPDAEIISAFCIGAEGPVRTVCIVSDCPLEEIEEIMLDYQSRTSVALCQILCKELWKISPKFTATEKGFENEIEGKKAAVIIGDRVFRQEGKHKVFVDLAEEWKKWTGLPFVFACWVSRGPVEEEFLNSFESALAFGLENLEASIDDVDSDRDRTLNYLWDNISYNFDDDKKEALQKFLGLLAKLD